jgi:hypothetical protein
VLLSLGISVFGGFLNWDDPWLVENNRIARGGAASLATIVCDLSPSARRQLGAEYLPVRDISWWIEAKLHDLNPHALRATNLCLYVGAVLVFHRLLRCLLVDGWMTNVAAWLFALHPVHVESVAWISSRKDVLALLFVGLTVLEYARRPGRRDCRLVVWVLLAVFSKSASVVLPLLLVSLDYWFGRRPHPRSIIGASVICVLAGFVHLTVGASLGMVQAPAGGSRFTALINAARSLLSYLALSLWPCELSLIHDPVVLQKWTLGAFMGVALLLSWLGFGLWSQNKQGGDRLVAFCALWFLIPLLPVTLLSLQNLVADRYLAIAVLGPCVLIARLLHRVTFRPLRGTLAGVAVLSLFVLSSHRAWVFRDSVLVMADAMQRSPESRRAAFQHGKALEAMGNISGALSSYREAFVRSAGGDEAAIRGALAVARLEEARGDRVAAREMLREAEHRYPGDARVVRRLRRDFNGR